MITKSYDILVDFLNSISYSTAMRFVQGDSGTSSLKFKITQTITGITVFVTFKLSDGTHHILEATAEDANTAVLILPSGVLSVSGEVKCQVALYEGTKRLTNEAEFYYTVIDDLSDGAIEASDQYPILTQLIEDCQDIVDAEELRVTAETAREEAEDTRISAESERVESDALRQAFLSAINAEWATWTPTITWFTAIPSDVVCIARYKKIGSLVNFLVTITSTNGNGATNLYVSLPESAPPKANGMTSGVNASRVLGGSSGVAYPYIADDGTSNRIGFSYIGTLTAGQSFTIRINGAYEVVV